MKTGLLPLLIVVTVFLMSACGGSKAKQVSDNGKSISPPPPLSTAQWEIAVYTVLIAGTFIQFDSNGRCRVRVAHVIASGAGTPNVAVGDSLNAVIDHSQQIEMAEIKHFIDTRKLVTVKLKYLRALRLGQPSATSWVVVGWQDSEL